MKRVRKPDSKDGWYNITPLDAGKLLEGRPNNRPLTEKTAQIYADQIRSGEWVQNGEPIILDSSGKLIEGQHRARAVAIAGKPIVSYVVHLNGVTSDTLAFDTIDSGKKRTCGDRLAIQGVKYYALVAAAANRIIRYDRGLTHTANSGATHVSPRETRIFQKKNSAELEEAADFVMKNREKSYPVAPAVLASVYFLATRIDKRMGVEYMTQFLTGECIPKGGPVGALRKRIDENSRGHEKVAGRVVWAWMVKAWVLFCNDKKVKSIVWKKNEKFPRFEDAVDA